MPGDEEDAIGLDQKPEGTGKPDRSASAPRHRVGVAGWDSTPCMSGLGKTMPAALTAQVCLDCRRLGNYLCRVLIGRDRWPRGWSIGVILPLDRVWLAKKARWAGYGSSYPQQPCSSR